MDAAVEISNLLYRYAEAMDAGDLEAVAALFADAELVLEPDRPTVTDAAGMLEIWRTMVRLHDDGTPRTKHIVTNPILDIDDDAGEATCRSYYTVLQQVGPGPLQPVAAGRYHDAFVRDDGVWRFSSRDYSMLDLEGDLTHHLRR